MFLKPFLKSKAKGHRFTICLELATTFARSFYFYTCHTILLVGRSVGEHGFRTPPTSGRDAYDKHLHMVIVFQRINATSLWLMDTVLLSDAQH